MMNKESSDSPILVLLLCMCIGGVLLLASPVIWVITLGFSTPLRELAVAVSVALVWSFAFRSDLPAWAVVLLTLLILALAGFGYLMEDYGRM